MAFKASRALVLVGLAAACMSGCTPSVSTESVKASTYQTQPKRLLIVPNLGDLFLQGTPNDRTAKFDSRLVGALTACGIQADTVNPTKLGLENPIAKKMKEYGPDAVLTVNWTKEMKRGSGGGAVSSDYLLQLTDIATKKVVWKATIDYGVNMSGMTADTTQVMAKTIVDKMKQDGIIPGSCNVPA